MLEIHPLTGIPEVRPGDDLAALLAGPLTHLQPRRGDVLVVTHKVVSKAEGAVRTMVGDEEKAYRAIIQGEAADIIRRRGDLVIARTRHGFICANAGVDRSNAVAGEAILLPHDPDASAHGIRKRLEAHFGVDIPVVITDTFGRPWRRGLVDIAIGVSGLEAILDLRGTRDATGRQMSATEVAVIDELAAAADLVMGKADGVPAALIRGWEHEPGDGRATDLVRSDADDMFR